MKVLIDTTPVSPDTQSAHKVRGVGRYISMLIKYLSIYDANTTYIFAKTTKELEQDTDVIHFPYFEPFFLAAPFYKYRKSIVTIHDLTPIVFKDKFPVGVKGVFNWKIQQFLLKKVNAIITDSESSKRDIERFTGISSNKIFVTYLAADPIYTPIRNQKVIENILKKYSLPPRFLLYVGDATWNKNLPRLIASVKRQELPLVVVGKALHSDEFDSRHPWNKDLLFARSTFRNDKQFISIGFVPDYDLACIYSSAELLLMPSLYEGFGLPVLEAMNCGCPVVCSRLGSLPEVAGKAAVYVDAYSIDSITSGIESIVKNNEKKRELSLHSVEQSQKFSTRKMIEDTVRVYRQVYENEK